MKTRTIHVPRSLIKYHMPHPEVYGESIVVLENEMTTDVYTFDDGKLYTQTNNNALISYLSQSIFDDTKTVIKNEAIIFTSISLENLNQLKTWFQRSPFRQFHLIDYCEDIIKLYISHAKTINSDVFMINMNDNAIGIIGFNMIDHVAILNLELYEYSQCSDSKIESMIRSIINYIQNEYHINQIIFPVFDYELQITAVINRVGFIKSNKHKIQIPTLSGYLYQIEYEFPMVKKNN